MKKLYRNIILLITMITCIPCFANNINNNLKLINTDGQGKLFQAGKIWVVSLQGNYNEMGQQYGTLMKQQINAFYHQYIEKDMLGQADSAKRQALLQFAIQAWSGYPRREQQIILGLSQATGLSVQQLILLDQNFMLQDILYNIPACSFLATWNQANPDHTLILGRNLDWFPFFRQFSAYATVVIYHPTDGSHRFASIDYAGMVGPLTALNDKNLFISVNDGSGSGGNVYIQNRQHILSQMMAFMLDSSSLDGLRKAIQSTRVDFPIILNVADESRAYVYEDDPQQVVERAGQNYIAATNDFLSPAWGLFRMKNDVLSMTRYHHLMQFADKNQNKVTLAKMQQFFDTPLQDEQGKLSSGVTEIYPQKKLATVTVYQVIAIPDQQTIFVKVPNYQDWTAIDLSPFFRQ